MDNILLLLALFAVMKSLFMTSLLPNRWYRLAFCLLLGAFVLFCHGHALEMNKLELQRVLSTQGALRDISLCVMVDVLLTVYFCLARIVDREDLGKAHWHTAVLRHLPSPLVFPALYYVHVTLFFTLTGVDFTHVTWGLATGVTVLFAAASFFLPRLVGGKEELIELVGLLTFVVCALVICCTIFHPSATVYSHASPVDWGVCVGTIGLIAAIGGLGFLWARLVRMYKQRKRQKQDA